MIRDFISEERLNSEIIDEIERIEEEEEEEEEERKADRSRMVYKGSNESYNFRKFKTIRAFDNGIRNNIINMSTANNEQDQLLSCINELESKTKPHNSESKM